VILGGKKCERLTAADDVGVVRGAGVVPAAGALPVVAVVGAVAGVVCCFCCCQ